MLKMMPSHLVQHSKDDAHAFARATMLVIKTGISEEKRKGEIKKSERTKEEKKGNYWTNHKESAIRWPTDGRLKTECSSSSFMATNL